MNERTNSKFRFLTKQRLSKKKRYVYIYKIFSHKKFAHKGRLKKIKVYVKILIPSFITVRKCLRKLCINFKTIDPPFRRNSGHFDTKNNVSSSTRLKFEEQCGDVVTIAFIFPQNISRINSENIPKYIYIRKIKRNSTFFYHSKQA